ncbi:MAG TPA: hypothetical protein VKP66_17145 [Steroidobacteraceae bacterium]|nr:hypothetical protein [Steroidobacteraceae bacterium]
MSKLLGIVALSMCLVGVASAGTQCYRGNGKPCPSPHTAPEVNAGSLAAGLTLLLGGLAVLRGRQTKGD